MTPCRNTFIEKDYFCNMCGRYHLPKGVRAPMDVDHLFAPNPRVSDNKIAYRTGIYPVHETHLVATQEIQQTPVTEKIFCALSDTKATYYRQLAVANVAWASFSEAADRLEIGHGSQLEVDLAYAAALEADRGKDAAFNQLDAAYRFCFSGMNLLPTIDKLPITQKAPVV